MGAKYTIGRPTQEVRLRNWPAGRVAQFKKAIELLETQLNQTMAAQVNQGDKRVLSPRVPKVTGLSVRSGFKNFQINFLEAKGIINLLFYEIQKDTHANFSAPTTYKIPQTSLTIPTDGDRERIHVRVRCVNSSFEVGPWSTSVTGQGSSSFRIAITRSASDEAAITPAQFGTWVNVGAVIFAATASNMSIHLHAGVHAHAGAQFTSNGVGGTVNHTVEPTVAIRILKAGVVMTTGQLTANGPSEANRTAPNTYSRVETAYVGTMVTKFEEFDGTEGDITYTIQAQVLLDSFAWTSTTNTQETYADNVGIVLDAIDVLEIVSGG
jgi:hypothetical protein